MIPSSIYFFFRPEGMSRFSVFTSNLGIGNLLSLTEIECLESHLDITPLYWRICWKKYCIEIDYIRVTHIKINYNIVCMHLSGGGLDAAIEGLKPSNNDSSQFYPSFYANKFSHFKTSFQSNGTTGGV